MSLAVIGDGASCEFRWRRWALLRDVVDIHLGNQYIAFFSIGEALGGVTVRVSARLLADEMRTIRVQLMTRSIEDLVIGPVTARVLYPRSAGETPRPLTRQELADIAPIGDSQTLEHYFASLVDAILDACEHPWDDGTLDVVDG